MLDCYILYMCMLQFLYACFGGFTGGEVDKMSNFFKILMFLGSLMNITSVLFLGSLTNIKGLCSSVMFLSSPTNIRAYVPRCNVANEHKPIFIGPDGPVGLYSSGSPKNKTYVPQQ
jgi:hypothetical protein